MAGMGKRNPVHGGKRRDGRFPCSGKVKEAVEGRRR